MGWGGRVNRIPAIGVFILQSSWLPAPSTGHV
jgi:hypothetical protein